MASSNVFLTLVSGVKTLVSSISAFTGNANEIISTDGSGLIDASLLPPGSTPKTVTVTANGNLTAGDFVNIYDDTGTLTAQPADEASAFPANGFVLAAIGDTSSGTAYMAGVNTGLAGLTAGVTYYLSTAGGVTATPPTSEDGIQQRLGEAMSATELCLPDPTNFVVIDLA